MTIYSRHQPHNEKVYVRANPDPPDYDMIKAEGWGEELELMDIPEIGLRIDEYPTEVYFAQFKKGSVNSGHISSKTAQERFGNKDYLRFYISEWDILFLKGYARSDRIVYCPNFTNGKLNSVIPAAASKQYDKTNVAYIAKENSFFSVENNATEGTESGWCICDPHEIIPECKGVRIEERIALNTNSYQTITCEAKSFATCLFFGRGTNTIDGVDYLPGSIKYLSMDTSVEVAASGDSSFIRFSNQTYG